MVGDVEAATLGTLGRLATAAAGALLIHPVSLGLAIGSLIGGLLFPSRRRQGPAQFANLQVTTATKGEPLPVVYGSNRLPGTILWYGNFQQHDNSQGAKGGGKGGSPPDPESTYSASFVIGICEGPINSISTIWAGKDPIDYGLEGTKFTIYTGTASQTPDSHVSGVMSAFVSPIYREAITVPVSGSVTFYTAGHPPVSSGTAKSWYFYNGGAEAGEIQKSLTFVTVTPGLDQAQLVDSSLGTVRVGWPSQTAVSNYTFEYQQTALASAYNLAYRHTAYVAFKDWDLGASATIPNFTFEVNGIGLSSGQITPVVSDGFNRADATTLDSPHWTQYQTGQGLYIGSNTCVMRFWDGSVSYEGVAIWNGTFGARQFSRFGDYRRGTIQDAESGVGTHLHSIQSVGQAYYGYSLTVNGGNNTWQMWRNDAAARTLLASSFVASLRNVVNNLALETSGSTLTGYLQTTPTGTLTLTGSDATYSALTVGKPALIMRSGIGGAGGEFWMWDQWTGGNLSGVFLIGSEYDINPVAALQDFLGNTRYGAGVAATAIDSDSWNTIATYAQSEDLFVSPIINERQPAVSQAEHILSYFDGILGYSQGVYKLKARRPDSAIASLSDADYVETAR